MIDWKRVAELRSEIGAEEFDEVVDLFLEEVETVITRLKSSPDPGLFEEDLHFIKGCAVNLGFADLATRCLAGETTAARGESESVNLQVIFVCYDESKAAFLEGIEAGMAA